MIRSKRKSPRARQGVRGLYTKTIDTPFPARTPEQSQAHCEELARLRHLVRLASPLLVGWTKRPTLGNADAALHLLTRWRAHRADLIEATASLDGKARP